MSQATPWVVVGLLGMIAGGVELVSKQPSAKAFRTIWTYIYIGLNAVVAGFALWLYVICGGPLPATFISAAWLAVVGIGVGGLGLFRSTVTVHLGSQPVPVDISRLPQKLLDLVEKAGGAAQQDIVSQEITQLMNGISFAKSYNALPRYLLAEAGTTVSDADANSLSAYINGLRDDNSMKDSVKAQLLGLKLANTFGQRALKRGIKALGNDIRDALLQ